MLRNIIRKEISIHIPSGLGENKVLKVYEHIMKHGNTESAFPVIVAPSGNVTISTLRDIYNDKHKKVAYIRDIHHNGKLNLVGTFVYNKNRIDFKDNPRVSVILATNKRTGKIGMVVFTIDSKYIKR